MDWSTFTRKIRIAAPKSKVYQAWVDCEQLTQWFLATANIVNPESESTIVQKGDMVTWTWHNYPNPSTFEIKEANGTDYLLFTFGSGMEVAIHLSKEDEYTVVNLVQKNIPTDENAKENFHIGCRQAWSTWMVNLKAWLEYRITLHDVELGDREDLFEFVNT